MAAPINLGRREYNTYAENEKHQAHLNIDVESAKKEVTKSNM
jgi:hypothetical protein